LCVAVTLNTGGDEMMISSLPALDELFFGKSSRTAHKQSMFQK